ncbi:MAG: AI-2E family transporter [Anaerolineae bacterium]|nr:AI-2E family transporter [Anaerolineae bacterium]
MSLSHQKPPDDSHISPPWSASTKFIVTGTLLFLLLAALYLLRQMVLPLILALILAYVLHPAVSFIVRRTGIKRGLVTGVVFLLLIAILISIPAATIPAIVSQINTFITNLPRTIEQVAAFLETPPEIQIFTFTIPVAQLPVDQYLDSLIRLVQTAGTQSLVLLRDVASATVNTVVWVVFVLFVAFWMVKDDRKLYDGLVSLVPRAYQPDARRLGIEIDTVWNAFLRGQVVLSLTIGSVVFVVAWILGLPSPIVLGVIAGVLEVVPYIGPILAMIPAALLAYFQYDQSWLGSQIGPFWFTAIVIVAYWGVQQAENYFIVPRVMGRQLKLHPVVVFVAALAGARVVGVLGIFLASPILATMRIFGRYISRKLSDRPPFSASDEDFEPLPVETVPDSAENNVSSTAPTATIAAETTSPEERSL